MVEREPNPSHFTCSRCGWAGYSLVQHWYAQHGGIPKARSRPIGPAPSRRSYATTREEDAA